MATPIHEIMAESSAGMARERARRKQDIADRRSYGLGNLEARMNRRPAVGNTAGRRPWTPGITGGPAVGNTAGRRGWTPGTTGKMIFSTPEENEGYDAILPGLSSGLVNTLPANNLMAKVYGIGDEGMTYDPWWETQVGGKAYGPFHKSGTVSEAPEDYPGLMKLEPGQNYSYMDLAGNKMLNQSDWTDYNPYRRSSPLIQDLSGMAGSRVPDEVLFEGIGDGNFKWNPWKSEDLINARHWLPEEYSINPGIGQTDDVFQFRKFPWMAGGGIASLYGR